MVEWRDYRISFPSPKPASVLYPVGRELETVHHVVHVPTACRILEDGRLRAGLIYDESRLNRSRISVTWLSANTWAYGSIYGNVQFSFSWLDQVAERQFYWVEAMTQYSPRAYRIMLTDRDLSKSKHVQIYDPAVNKGPLRKREGKWYWNGEYTSEFMIEADISLESCTDFAFIDHHKQLCRPHGTACKERGMLNQKPASQIIAFLLGRNIHSIDHVLEKPSVWNPDRPLSDAFDLGINGITRVLGGKKERFGGAIRQEDSRKAVMRGALALYGGGQIKAARELVALMKSEDVFETALTELVNEHFDIKDWEIPSD